MSDFKNLEKLNTSVQKTIGWFAKELMAVHGDEILSINLYGSAVDESFNIKRSNINFVIVFKKIGINTLQKSLKLVKRGVKKKIIAPLFFTEEHIVTSCDTFPIEFLEIRDKHVCIYGEDVFATLSIDNKNLRLQCEQQVKSLLIKLRQSYLEIGLEKKGIEKLIVESFRTVLPVFRTVLRLKGETIPPEQKQLIMQVASLAGLSTSIFMMVLQDKAGDEKIGNCEAVKFLGNYLAEIQKLAQFVDSF